MRGPEFVLMGDRKTKTLVITLQHKIRKISSLSFECKFSADITKRVRVIFTLPRHVHRINKSQKIFKFNYKYFYDDLLVSVSAVVLVMSITVSQQI